jgi:RNA polymerase sigma factor (sigma-70 family)
MNRTPENGMERGNGPPVEWLKIGQPLLDQLFADSGASSWGLPCGVFADTLELSAKKHFGGDVPGIAKLEGYFFSLHLQDLALACGCAEGNTAAWDYFVATYRGYLRSVAAFLLRCPPDSPAACELADSLFAELYGIGEVANRRSLFRYFHGRSSLKTWLRAVLAQRHVDTIRTGRRFTDLDSIAGDGNLTLSAHRPGLSPAINPQDARAPRDPHRDELVGLFRRTLEIALGLLAPRDKERLRLYYAAEQTLAEIGRKLGEHESSVSRNLDRTRRELRQQVELALRKGSSTLDGRASVAGLSDAQIALCFEYASEDAPIDLDKLLPETHAAGRKPESKKP